MNISNVNHLSVVSTNEVKTAAFLKAVLGCVEHNHSGWFRLPGCSTLVHVIEIDDAERPSDEEMFHYYNHNALEVDDIRKLTQRCISGGYAAFQMDNKGEESPIDGASDLTFGLRTVFVRDPDGNLWEFAQRGFSLEELWT